MYNIRKPMHAKRLARVFVFLLALTRAGAEEAAAPDLPGYIAPGEEAPEALLSLSVGDAEVGVFVDGVWKAGLEGGIGLRVLPGRGIEAPASVASLASGLAFSQDPALSLAVRLEQRWFVEAGFGSIGEGGGGSDYLPAGMGYLKMGFEAAGDELLRHLTIGTQGIEIGGYPFLVVPGMGPNSLGAGALLQGPVWTQELLLRLDALAGESALFIGMNKVVETRVGVDAYLRGRSFLLPDAAVVEASVLLEDSAGGVIGEDGRHYREMGLEDGRLSVLDGSLYLAADVEGRVLVWYLDEGGREVGDASLGRGALPGTTGDTIGDTIDPDGAKEDFSWAESYLGRPLLDRQVMVGGRAYLRLWEPGEFSPFEVPSSYPLEGSVGEEEALVFEAVRRGSDRACGEAPTGLGFRAAPEQGRFVVSLGLDPREDIRERFPFEDPARLLYGPLGPAPPGYPDCEIRIRRLEPVEFLQVPGPVVPGSVRVVRNGQAESRFTVDAQSGRVDLDIPVVAGDVVQVFYRSTAAEAASPDVVLAWGNRLRLGEAASLDFAGGVLWSVEPGAFSTAPYASTGGLVGSAALRGSRSFGGEREEPAGVDVTLRYDVSAGVSVSQADTTGVRRLFGMEEQGRLVPLSGETARPSAVPAEGAGVPAGVQAATRGKLVYKDYRQHGVLGGGGLLRYDTPEWPPPEQRHQYVDGEVTGPYDVGGSSAQSGGTSLALEFTMDQDESWVGMQLPVAAVAGLEDLSGIEGIVCSLSADAAEGSYDVYLQIGALGEDLDGDGELDRETSADSAGFWFNDSAKDIRLRLGAGPDGQGNGVLDSEDVDGNGFLDPEEGTSSVLIGPESAGVSLSSRAGGGWVVASQPLTATERRRLTRTRFVRILLVKTSGGACSGRLLVDRVELSGSPFWVDAGEVGTGRAREIRETDLPETDRPALLLEEAYPEVGSRFHAGGMAQEVLELAWNDVVPAALLLRGFPPHGSGGIPYRKLALFLRLPEITLVPGESLAVSVSLLDGGGRGMRMRFSPHPFADWRQLVADFDAGRLTLAGDELEGASVEMDSDAGDLVELRVLVEGASSGRLYLDEMLLTSPRAGVGAAGEVALELEASGPLLSIRRTVLVSAVRLRQVFSAISAGFSPLFGSPASAPSWRSTSDVALQTAIGRFEGFAAFDGSTSGVLGSGGHQVTIPALLPRSWPLGLGLSEAFSCRGPAASPRTHREMGLTATLGRLSAGGGIVLDVDGGELEQAWQSSLAWSPARGPRLALGVQASKQASGFELPGSWYLAWWADGYARLLPWVGGEDLWRKGRAELRATLSPLPVGIEIGGSIAFSSTDMSRGQRTQQTSLGYDIRLPVSFRPGGGAELVIAPAYRNELRLSALAREGAQDFSADLEEAAAALGHHGWLLGFVPGVDVFSPAAMLSVEQRLREANDYPLTDASWTPGLSLAFSRGVGSRLLDLLVPVYLDASLGREVKLSGSLTLATTTASVAARATALNLFGRSGAYRLFSFYDRDELSGTARVSVSVPAAPEPGSPANVELEVGHLLSFASGTSATVELENKLRLRYGEEAGSADSVEARVSWLHLQGLGLPSFLAGILRAPGGRPAVGELRHTERLTVDVQGASGGTQGGAVAVVARHETVLSYADLGFLKGRLGAGVDVRAADGLWAPGFGVEAAIEIELRF